MAADSELGADELNEDRVPGLSLGIIGGGQLGRMMCWEARRMGIRTVVLDPDSRPPAYGLADRCIVGELSDPTALAELAADCHVITYEIEHIDAAELIRLEEAGALLRPSPSVLCLIQDKFAQKQRLADAGIPVPEFRAFDGVDRSAIEDFGLPCVQKTRKGGYDGRGVKILNSVDDELLPGPSMLERLVNFRCELAVIVARSPNGDQADYPVVEMVFDAESQICNSVCAPARISEQAEVRAREVAAASLESMDAVGLFAVELFLDHDDGVYVNEIAPRPHNSGHWTIEGAETSQFEQHIRAVCDFPLGSTELVRPSVMLNLLGAPGAMGAPNIYGYRRLLETPGAYLHWYEKREVRPGRKMGHITLLDAQLERALSRAADLEQLIRIEGREIEKQRKF